MKDWLEKVPEEIDISEVPAPTLDMPMHAKLMKYLNSTNRTPRKLIAIPLASTTAVAAEKSPASRRANSARVHPDDSPKIHGAYSRPLTAATESALVTSHYIV